MINFGFGPTLKPLDSEWLGLLRKWRNDPRIYRWCRQSDVISDVEQSEWFKRQSDDPSIKMYLIFGSGPEPIGVCGFTSIDRLNRRAEFSLYIDPDRHKYGHGRQALKTLLSHGFRNLGLNLIWGETFDGNPAEKMFERLGMKKEGTRREFYFKDGKWLDAHLYSIKALEWESICNICSS